MTNENTAQARETALKWENALSSADSGRIEQLLADDCTVWYNYEQVEHGKDADLAILERTRRDIRNLRYSDVRLLVHADGFIEQATLEGETSDGPLAAPFCRVAVLKNGKISRIDEYFDSPTLAPPPK